MKRLAVTALAGAVVAATVSQACLAQDFSTLRINEVIADNATQQPLDFGGSTPDMVEIYNPAGGILDLGTADPETSLALSDTEELPVDDPQTPVNEGPYTFRAGVQIPAEGFLVIFCDGNLSEDFCEPHASFKLSSSGEEPITLWGPVVGTDGQGNPIREMIDQVWLPPLKSDVSFGRFPDGAGPAPVPLDEVLDTFKFNPPGDSTFGSCSLVPGSTLCPGGKVRKCYGAPNNSGGPIKPRVELLEASTNSPAAMESVVLRVRVEDEKEPVPPNIASVEAVYRVDGGPEEVLEFVYDAQTGVQHDTIITRDDLGNVISERENPFKIWTEWEGEIPGQAAGARVEFILRCRDADGLEDTSPGSLCSDVYSSDDVGPCDREFGGPGCERDSFDVVTCKGPTEPDEGDGGGAADTIFTGMRYISCSKPFTYMSGYEVPENLRGLVVNEIVASQTEVLLDPTEASKICNPTNPFCKFDDFFELYNSSDQTISLEGLWLSNSRFHPRGWQFPAGSEIAPGEYLIVWLDSDGGKCPCSGTPVSPDSAYCSKPVDEQPCFWECPDPTDPAKGAYHTNFSINAGRDQLYIYDMETAGFGLIHGTSWGRDGVFEGEVPADHSLSLIPDGDRDGCWVLSEAPTVDSVEITGAPNVGECPDTEPKFIRGDADGNCAVEITDGIFTLNYLFGGGKEPECQDAADTDDSGTLDITDAIFVLSYLFLGGGPPPYPGPSGPSAADPTPDTLSFCVAPSCE